MRPVFALLFSFSLFLQTFALPIGFKTTVSQAGLDYLKDVGMQLLEKKFGTVAIPDESGEADTTIGKIDWTLTSIVLSKIVFPSTALKIEPGVGMTLSISGASASLTSAWHYRKKHWPHISDHGTADISVSQLSLQIKLQLTTVNGLPNAKVISASDDIGHIDLKLHGGASWLYDLFIGIFKNKVKGAISDAIEKALTTNLAEGLNKAFAKLPITHAVTSTVEIDYRLVENPLFTAPCLTLPELGEFYEIGKPTECPTNICKVPALPNQVAGSMIEFMVSEYVANTAGYVFYTAGSFRIDLTNDMVPSWSPVNLNTSSWEFILPSLYAKYPNKLMAVGAYATSSPQLVFSKSGISVTVNGQIDVNVLDPNPVPGFSLTSVTKATANATINGTRIVGTVQTAVTDFTVKSTNIGPFNITNIDAFINAVVKQGLIPFANSVLEKGFGIPVIPGVTFITPKLSENDGFVSISTSFHYNPTD